MGIQMLFCPCQLLLAYLLSTPVELMPNVPSHRLPPKPRPFMFIQTRKRAAIRCDGKLDVQNSVPILINLLEPQLGIQMPGWGVAVHDLKVGMSSSVLLRPLQHAHN